MMSNIYFLENPIQTYAWGSKTAIPELLGKAPTETPQAELWMGAHPKAPSLVSDGNNKIPLYNLIEKKPVEVLGREISETYHNRMPYLFKVLAASEPLSIQAHPSLAQAVKGFERENQAGIALDAFNRSYKDDNHKPECLCALTPFWAMAGFRKKQDTMDYLKMLCPRTLGDEIDMLGGFTGGSGLRIFFHSLVTKSPKDTKQIIEEAMPNATRLKENERVFDWIVKLQTYYPEDIGVLSPAFLNLICLKPGQAIFLTSGQLHAYLEGVAMELMANSDNVLRGGLTPKFIDVPELLNVLDFSELELIPLTTEETHPCEKVYQTPAREFRLSNITVNNGCEYLSSKHRSVEILFCVEGHATVTEFPSKEAKEMSRGVSLLVPASVDKYSIRGEAAIYRASVPFQ